MAVYLTSPNGKRELLSSTKNHKHLNKKCQNKGKAKPTSFTGDLNKPGRLRVGHLLSLLSISHSGLYSKIDQGLIPKPDGRDGKRPYWFTETIRPLVTKQ